MKISFKQVLAVGALAVASTSAFADIAAPSTGNGELALYVLDVDTGESYARGLQVYTNSVLTQSDIQADVANGTYTVGEAKSLSVGTVTADANLSAFLESNAGDTIVWTVAGGVSGNVNTVGAERLIFSVTDDLSAGVDMSNTTLRSTSSAMNGTVNTSNLNISGSVLGDGSSTSAGVSGYNAGSTNLATDTYGTYLQSTVALGSAANVYLLSSAGGIGADTVLVYTLSSLTLSADGTLSSAAAPVPVPAALWLLGSGLAGLVGIGRRKQVA